MRTLSYQISLNHQDFLTSTRAHATQLLSRTDLRYHFCSSFSSFFFIFFFSLSNMAGAHILLFPYPAQGHLLPLLDLAQHLHTRGLQITILVTPANIPFLTPLLSTSPSIQTLVLPFPNYPSLPQGLENAKDLPHGAFLLLMHALAALYHPILFWFRSHPSPPVAILSDFFFGWTQRLAEELGIPRLVFSPSGALALCFVNCLWRHMPRRREGDGDDTAISFPEIPGCPTFPWWQLSPLYRSYREGEEISEFVRDGMLMNFQSFGFVFNSFADLEGVYLQHMKKCALGVWAVGPTSQVAVADRGGSSSIPANDVMTWLERWERGSVVYVCFGSQGVLSAAQMEAAAERLEKSGVPFLWCVKKAAPKRFEEGAAAAGGRGLVIRGWVPQVAILNHDSVGSFLSHCGWNSVLEGIVAGVPFLAWPLGADQFINATLLVDQLGVGVRVCDGPSAVPNPDELARCVAELMSPERAERGRAGKLKAAALSAVKEGGSSWRDLDGLVEQLSSL